MDFGTIVAECLSEIAQATGSVQGLANCKQAICEAINFNSRYGPFRWQERKVVLTLTAADTSVALPDDFGKAVGKIYYVKVGEPTNRHEIIMRTLDAVFTNNSYLTNAWQSVPSSYTKVCAVDFTNNTLVMTPQAESTGDYLELRYQKRGKPPVPSFDGTNWAFKDPYTDKAITDSWTNEWLTDGRYLTKLRALYLLWARWYGGTEASQTKSGMYLQQWTEELNRLYGENAKMGVPAKTSPSF